jgi:hypothetical protein
MYLGRNSTTREIAKTTTTTNLEESSLPILVHDRYSWYFSVLGTPAVLVPGTFTRYGLARGISRSFYVWGKAPLLDFLLRGASR